MDMDSMAGVDHGLWEKMIKDVVANGGNLIRPWFTHLQPMSLEHGLLEILAPGLREQQYCQNHAGPLFTQAAQNATGRLIGVSFLAPAEADEEEEQIARVVRETMEPAIGKPSLIDDYVFGKFVTGPCNRLAGAAAKAVGDQPGQAYNPLFIHGSSGLGKTHLLQATCHQVLQETQGAARVQFLSCEEFVNHFIGCVERGQLHEFRYRYRHVDILAIDDIQFLAGHEQSQEEFFHTFNTLYQAKKQIILSSDRGPQDTQLEERLVSRFNWGLVTRIDRPCYETRMAILRKKARERNVVLPDDVVCFVAGSIDSNTRELEGAIAKIQMLAQVSDCPISLRLAEEAIGGAAILEEQEISIDAILAVVTKRYNVRLIDLLSKKRTRSIALPRQVCMYLARKLTRNSLEEIGGHLGGRDHTTVIHANRTIEQLRGNDPQFQATLEKLTEEVKAGI
jgi:chromosomal replication initiator protein